MPRPVSTTCEPPPRPIENTSGMRKFVRTPPTSTAIVACRGKPLRKRPTSEVVPPMSMTIASETPERNAAPLIELVGPDANVSTGNASAAAASSSVPSFCVR